MIGNSTPAYLLIRLADLALSAVAPCLLTSVAAGWYFHIRLPHLWTLWCISEGAFFCWFLWRKRIAQKDHPNPPVPTREQRLEIISHIKQTLRDEAPSPDWLCQWFYGAKISDIYHDNLLEWLLWGFFQTTLQQQQLWSKQRTEANEYIAELEKLWNIKFPDGYNSSVKSIRLSADPVRMHHRPLLWYSIIGILDLITHVQLRRLGFSHYKPSTPHHRAIFPFSLSLFSKKSSSTLSYWYKPPRTRVSTNHAPATNHSPATKNPLILSHGIGIGLHSYLGLLTKIAKIHPDIPIFCIENLHVSMRFVAEVPSKEEVCQGVCEMLHQEGYESAIAMGHSIGTMTLSYLIHDPATRPMISGLIFIDPITFLLHLPDVAFNFLYRPPARANEWLYSFVAREPGIAWSLSRRFFWFDGVIWKDEIDTTPGTEHTERWRGRTIVILAGMDPIVPRKDVWNYLTNQEPILRTKPGTKKDSHQSVVCDGVEVMWYPFLDHGAAIFQGGIQDKLCSRVGEMCAGKYLNQ
eukprot:Phypoly_transcript_07309.p1 GENE.Phypoly_transcript_07309~~Phypoly_transcript_07309.p1  ORF type:complete len:521 (+),score=68.27 Phypoly_transcript_07309:88-1650(+)